MIGLIGGLGVGAGIHYYRELAAAHDAEGRPLELVMVHAHLARVTGFVSSGDRLGLARYLSELLARLKDAGATVGVIPAVTPHICIDELVPMSPLPLLNLLDVVAAEIAERQLRRVALFGTRFVIESDLFGRLPEAAVVRPTDDEIAVIHDIYTRLARSGQVVAADRDRLIALARTLDAREPLDAVVLAGTDLALLFDDTNTPFPSLDCARAHIQAIMRA